MYFMIVLDDPEAAWRIGKFKKTHFGAINRKKHTQLKQGLSQKAYMQMCVCLSCRQYLPDSTAKYNFDYKFKTISLLI